MKKLVILIFIIIFVGMLILLSQARVRHVIFTGATQFPEFAIMQSMKGGLVTRDFSKVMPWLDKQFELANSYGGEKNRLTPGLLENLKKAYDVAVLREERELFIPLFEKVYALNPNNINLNIMLASAYQYSDERKSLSYLEKARKIVPSDQRIFHLANVILRDSDNIEEKLYWCEAYENEQFGDYEEYKSSSLLGIGYRRLALEFEHSNTRSLFLNEGLTLGEKVKYEFILGDSYPISKPSIRFSSGGGLEILFHNIQFFSKGKLTRTYSNKEINLFPETGYVIEGRAISTNPLGENIFIELNEIDNFIADKLIIELTINKLLLNNLALCRV